MIMLKPHRMITVMTTTKKITKTITAIMTTKKIIWIIITMGTTNKIMMPPFRFQLEATNIAIKKRPMQMEKDLAHIVTLVRPAKQSLLSTGQE